MKAKKYSDERLYKLLQEARREGQINALQWVLKLQATKKEPGYLF